jgi:flagellar motor switch protein FliN
VNGDRTRPGKWFAEEWAALLGQALDALAGERPDLACTAPPEGAALADVSREIGQRHGAVLWWKQNLPLPGEPAIWIGAPQSAWSRLAGGVARPDADGGPSGARETYLEILRQSLGELARIAGRRWNREAACPPGTEQSEPPPAAEFYLVEAADPDAGNPPLLVAITGAPEEPPAETAALAPRSMPDGPGGPRDPQRSKTFDLLMGVELPVCVSFGRVQISLQDVLKLTAGSIIELNRSVDQPVEVIVNNCVVAQGEVVVVEGNYGVRIQRIMSRQQRLESLP